MLPGPVFAAELVTSVRRVRYFLLRGLYGLILLSLVWINFSSVYHWGYFTPIQQAAQLASGIMAGYAWLQLLAILLVAPALAAGAISTERERRTIEYLFATDLSNAELVLGKTAARLMHVTYLILIGVPVLALVSLLGGISADLLLAVFLIAVSTMLMVVGISVCLSVWSARARDALTRVYLVLAALLLLPLIALAWLSAFGNWSGTAQSLVTEAVYGLLAINPLWVQERIWTGRGPAGANMAWQEVLICVVGQTGVALACLALATVAVRRVHLAASGRSEKVNRLSRFRWRPTLGNQPMLWKEMFSSHANTRLGMAGRIAAMLLVVSTLAVAGYGFGAALDAPSYSLYHSRLRQYYLPTGMILTAVVGSGGMLLVGARAAGAITGEVERDCWVSLLSTPLSAREIVLAKVAGSVYAARWIVALLLWIWGLGVLLDPGYGIIAMIQLAVWACTALFASALGVRYSLACSTTLRSMGATLATLIFVSGGYLFCCIPIFFGGPDGFVFTAAFVPMLLVLPAMAYIESAVSTEPAMIPTFIVGLVGYGFGSFALIAASISALRWTTNAPWIQGAPAPRLPAKREATAAISETDLVIAELVDESPESPAT